jgi:Ca2+-binding RTX toxin-like protein
MKRIMVAMTLMGAALVVASGVAWAATVNCQVGVFCEGTDQPDELIATNSVDRVFGKGGSDFLAGKKQNDVLYGGSGNDFIMAVEASLHYPNLQERDLVFCGPGTDTVYYMEGVDRIFDCERKNPGW